MKNKQVKEIHNRWDKIWKNQELDLKTRLKAYSILKNLEAIAAIYEENITLDEEDVQEIFIYWNKDMRPIPPEYIPNMLKKINNEVEKIKGGKE